MERLKRKIDTVLVNWKNTPDHMPLIIKGARQIGKTEAIKHFAEGHYKSLVEINFVLQKQYKDIFDDLITSQIQTSSDDEKEILEAFLGKASADIPFLVEDEDVVISGKLNTNNLFEAYSELEEYTEQDVFMLCKVIGVMNKEKVEVFNPLKDFIKLPRAVRRGMDEDSKKGLESICVDGPVLKVEVIAIYK